MRTRLGTLAGSLSGEASAAHCVFPNLIAKASFYVACLRVAMAGLSLKTDRLGFRKLVP